MHLVYMKLTNGFTVGDIIGFEVKEDIHILDEFKYENVDIILKCLMLGNKCNFEDACEILKEAREEYELTEVIEMLIKEMFGKEVEKKKETSKNKDKKSEKKEVKKLSDILLESYAELQTYDNRLDFNSFLNMDTKLVWKYTEIVKKVYIKNENKRLRNTWEQIIMLFGMFTGEINKCPEIGDEKQESIREKLEKKYMKLKGDKVGD